MNWYLYLVFLHLAVIANGQAFNCIVCDGFYDEGCNFPYVHSISFLGQCRFDNTYCTIGVWFSWKLKMGEDPTKGVVRRWCGQNSNFREVYGFRRVYIGYCWKSGGSLPYCNADDRKFIDKIRRDNISPKVFPQRPLLIAVIVIPLVFHSSLC